MPKNVIGSAPFAVRTVDTDEPISPERLVHELNDADSVSLCIRSADGHANRGGYFFHIRSNRSKFHVLDFQGNEIATFALDDLAHFINHCSGREFNEKMFQFCQTVINYKQDQSDREIDA